ncbi:MAG: MFS transporter [Exilibacterium sp.]
MISSTTTERTTQRLALFVVCMGSFLSPLNLSAVNVAVPSMASALQADAVLVSWMPTAFLLSNVALMLPAGKLADNFGRKRLYVLGLIISSCASLGAFFANSIEWVLFFRLIQGGGSAMYFGTGLAILTSVFPADKRGLPLGVNVTSVYIGLSVAPALGGLMTETFGWRSVFLLPIPLAALLVGVILYCLKGEWRKDTYSPFDWTGAVIFAGWTLALVVGLAGLPRWPNVLILLLALGLFALFIWHQSRHSEPLIRVQLFRGNRPFSFSLASSSLMYASNYPLAFLLSLYLQYVRGLSPLDAGRVILVQAVAMALLAPFAGKLSDRIEPRVISTAGCLAVATGFALLSQLGFDTSPGYIGFALFFIGMGFGLFSSPNHNAVMSSVSPTEVGVAAATINLARVSGNLVGISLVNLLVHHYLGDRQITPDQHGSLLSMVNVALRLAFGIVVVAVLLSAWRGRIRGRTLSF